MSTLKRLGDLERSIMDHLWDTGGPQTVRQVHHALCAQRHLAYTTVMTVLHRLSSKDLVVEIREDRAYRYAPTHTRDEMVAALMADALDQVTDRGCRRAALMEFVGRVGAEEAEALRRVLAEVDKHRPAGRVCPNPPRHVPGTPRAALSGLCR